MLEYKISNNVDFTLIIEPGPYCYYLKKGDSVYVSIKFTSDKKFNKDDVFIEEEESINTFWINKIIGVPCKVIIKNKDKILDEIDFI